MSQAARSNRPAPNRLASVRPATAVPPMREKAVSGTVVREQPLFGRLVGGRYRIRSFVGAGVIGATYLARQTSQERNVAVKAVHSALARREGFAEAFLREAKAASLIEHASFVKVLDFGEEPDGTLFVAMEHVDGRTLADVLAEEGPLSEARIVSIVAEALRGLGAAHAKGFVHRGLDPQNLFVVPGAEGRGETVKIADFGVASLRQLDGKGLGHAGYAAPEQARGGKADKRSDLYSIGVVLYEMLTGKFPAVGSPAEGAPHASAALPECSKRLADVAFRAMQLSPAARYPSARAMLDAVLGKTVLSERTTAMPAQDFEDDVEEVEVGDLEPSQPPPAGLASPPARARLGSAAISETSAPSRVQHRAQPAQEDLDATVLGMAAMPTDGPDRTLIMAVPEGLPPAPSSYRAMPAMPAAPSAGPAPDVRAPAARGPALPRKRDWVPFVQGVAVFAVATTVGILALLAVFE